MSVKEILKDTDTKMKKCLESAKREFNEVRTGRAHPGLIEGMHVDYFGTATPFKQLASISSPDPRTIIIQPWDPSVIPEIEKTILTSNLGVMPSNDGKIVRLTIPQLSDERRQELAKMVKDMAEQSRVSLRTVRHASNDRLKKLQSEKTIAEDEYFKSHDEVQKLTDKYIKEIDVMLEQKNKALTDVS